MKKLVTIAALLFAFAFTTQAQYYCRAYQFTKAGSRVSSGGYNWGPDQRVEIRVAFVGNKITLNEGDFGTYTTSSKLTDKMDSDGGHECTWWASDEQGAPCVFKLITYRNGSMLMEMDYDYKAFKFVIIV